MCQFVELLSVLYKESDAFLKYVGAPEMICH